MILCFGCRHVAYFRTILIEWKQICIKQRKRLPF